MHLHIQASQLAGDIALPGSKSQSLRAMLLASLASGTSHIQHLPASPDVVAMRQACVHMGAVWTQTNDGWQVIGVNQTPQFMPGTCIDAGNSGLVFRFMTAIAALSATPVVVTGDTSICQIRPIRPLLSALQQLGARVRYLTKEGHAPFEICGPVIAGDVVMQGQDSQWVSAMLWLAALLPGVTTLRVQNPGERPWVDLTLSWLTRLGVGFTAQDHNVFTIAGPHQWAGFVYQVPGDLSSMAYPLCAALLCPSTLTISHVDLQDPQGDQRLLGHLQAMGADFTIDAARQTLSVSGPQALHGIDVDVNDCIDMVTILAVMAAFASGKTTITGAAMARQKECNRLVVMQDILTRMGAVVTSTPDGLCIEGGHRLQATCGHSHQDHRVVLAWSVAAMAMVGETVIAQSQWVQKSFPNYVTVMQAVGAKMHIQATTTVVP